MKNTFLISIAALTLFSCSSSIKETATETFFSDFKPVAPNFETETLILPEGYSYEIIFSEGDTVMNSEAIFAPAKGKHDCVAYLPIEGSSEHGYLVVGHETGDINDILGDGGGTTVLEIKKVDGKWQTIGERLNLDYRTVGGTYNNCGGKINPKGTFFTAEENYFETLEAYQNKGFSYKDSIDGYAAHENFGWIVESNIEEGKALQKLYSMGRYKHEDAYCLDDHKTVYLSNDATPAVFFKFVADQADDFTKGTLFAYTESEEEHWIAIPDSKKALLNARDTAIALGATMYIRHEWISKIDNKLYIGETGRDTFDLTKYASMKGKPANYLKEINPNVYSDPHGRILEYDLETNQVRPIIEGGVHANDNQTAFSSPDCILAFTDADGDKILISEDITSTHFDKVQGKAKSEDYDINEIYLAELDKQDLQSVEDLKRFAVGPKGCETTGLFFTPDQKTLFVAIQHPDKTNAAPFNKSMVVAITRD